MKNLLPALLLPLALLGATQPTLAHATTAANKTNATTRTISGRVTDAQGQALPGVTVLLKGTNIGVSTDINGRYTLVKVPTRPVVLVFSFVGYSNLEHAVPVGTTTVDVVLREDQKSLSEVVVTGYGT